MKFITVEQFLESDKKVRDAIIEWWKPSIGDLTESKVKGEVWCLVDDIQVKRAIKTDTTFTIPLLTVGQLIEFIEYKTNAGIEIKITCIDVKNTLVDSLWEEVQRLCNE